MITASPKAAGSDHSFGREAKQGQGTTFSLPRPTLPGPGQSPDGGSSGHITFDTVLIPSTYQFELFVF